jgi:hypothetical protein
MDDFDTPKIWFVRHAESEANVRRIYANTGCSFPLTVIGLQQAIAVSLQLSHRSEQIQPGHGIPFVLLIKGRRSLPKSATLTAPRLVGETVGPTPPEIKCRRAPDCEPLSAQPCEVKGCLVFAGLDFEIVAHGNRLTRPPRCPARGVSPYRSGAVNQSPVTNHCPPLAAVDVPGDDGAIGVPSTRSTKDDQNTADENQRSSGQSN